MVCRSVDPSYVVPAPKSDRDRAMTSNIHELCCSELASLLSPGEVSAIEIANALIDEVRKFPDANAFVDFDAEAVRAEAENSDRLRLSGGPIGPLHGVPVAFKDNINVKGYTTTAGTAGLRHFRPRDDAPVTARLRQAGAIVFGKNNMHELAYGTTTNNALFGAAKNPFDPDRVCGGSSGGSACAVAHRMVPASIGTDTGGSVRIPASFCGLWGYRPSPGRWPTSGIVPISSTRDTPGPIARSAFDLTLLDSVVVGYEPASEARAIRGLRIGIPDAFFWDLADPKVERPCRDALGRLGAAGAVLLRIDAGRLLAHHAASTNVIAFYEGRATLEQFLDTHDVGQTYETLARAVAAQDVRSILLDQLGNEMPAVRKRYREAIDVHRPALQDEYRNLFAQNALDVIAFPTALITPPRIGDEASVILNGVEQPLFPTTIHNTDVGSNAGLPGITIPVGLSDDGLPVGLAFDAAAGADRLLLDIAMSLEPHFSASRPGWL